MKIATFEGVKNVQLRDYPVPVYGDDEVLVKIEACAICTWEQRVYLGIKSVPFPFVGGHEISATIVGLGKNVSRKMWSIGDKVVYGTNLACGDCYQCKTQNEQNCEYFDHTKAIPGTDFIGMGGFSEYLVVKTKHLFPYHKITALEACLTEPVSCCVHSVETAEVVFGDFVMVVGCGIMGQIHVQCALKKGAVVIAVDTKPERLELARKMGAQYTINNEAQSLETCLRDITGGKGVEVIFNTTPFSKVAQEMESYLAINGRQVLYSSFYPDTAIGLSPDTLHKKAHRLMGTANSNSRDFMRALRMLDEGVIDVKPYISATLPLDNIADALDLATSGDNYRVVLVME